jgi:hypothetical protein
MRFGHRVIFATTVLTLPAALGLTVAARSQAPRAPLPDDVAFATEVSNLMVNELVAALFTEFDETTPATSRRASKRLH